MKEFLKKYWGIIVAVLGAIFVGVTMSKNSQNRKEKRKIKKDIKETDKKIKNIQQEKEVVNQQRDVIAKEIKKSEVKVNVLKEKLENVNNNDTDVEAAVNHLKNIGK